LIQSGSWFDWEVSIDLKSVSKSLVYRGFEVTQAMPKQPIFCADDKKSTNHRGPSGISTANILPEEQFRQMLCRERKRSERSRRQLLLMLVGSKDLTGRECDSRMPKQVAESVCHTIRETDLAGWFEEGRVLGVIFTELGSSEVSSAIGIIQSKVTAGLQESVKANQLEKLQISFHAFPDDWAAEGHGHVVPDVLYTDLCEVEKKKKAFLLIKRAMDVIGSASALLLLSPVFVVLAIIIKATSKGPILFRQQRVGQYGAAFVFLKFRSMYVSTSADIHREFVRNFIAGKADTAGAEGKQKETYKITNDPRVTGIGKFMRRTSLDEFPQFWNVLKGDMSLVGPRPPIPYEIEAYDIWHRRRLLEAKPGITGLWQVYGRSKTTFDDMVRMDLQYSKNWSLLLDLKILLQTPCAVFSGDGAH
jgi:lipopolysaccharide/colanic/teichoic acid biosynthesis glycosyltransferase